MIEQLALVWSHARGAHEGQLPLSIVPLLAVAIGGGALLLGVIAVFLALEPAP
jgi:hypothetical protein